MRWLTWLAIPLFVAACTASGGGPASSPSPPPPSASPTEAAAPSPSPSPQPPQRQEAPLPQPMEETGAATAAGRLYVLGGFTPAEASWAGGFYFDGAWHAAPPLPLALDHLGAAALGDRLYVAGGYSNGPASARLLRLDGETWTELAPLHHARGALALVSVGDRLYALGGASRSGGPEVPQAEVYDPAANAWSDLPAIPNPRDHLAGFAWKGMACAAGGRTPNTPVVDCFDAAQHAWTAFPQLPFPTSGAGAGSLGERIFVAGGEDAQESRVVQQVATFGAAGWTAEPMLVPRHGFQLAPYGGRLWACGGGTEAGLHASATCTSLA